MIEPTRIRPLNDAPARRGGKYVVYWMQQSQRVGFNHALEYAIELANDLDVPAIVCFGLMDDYPEANERHYAFLLEGLADVEAALRERKLAFFVRHGAAYEAPLALEHDACVIVCDRGYLRHQVAWRERVADDAKCQVIQVESDVVVPVDEVSNKHETAARTIRPKLHKLWTPYFRPLRATPVKHASLRTKPADVTKHPTKWLDVSKPDELLKKLKLDRSVKATTFFKGGETEAGKKLDGFVKKLLDGYGEARNDPKIPSHSSHLSTHLHYGHISPVEMCVRVMDAAKHKPSLREDADKFVEELVVRRELSMNFVRFHLADYDRFACIPNWAKKTLAAHADDKRETTYTLKQLEAAETNDPYWNAAQREMVVTGFMHNYMRMYWGKCILGWMKSPEEAFATTLHLNNKYFYDGRDANSFANVAWIYGLHDRPWANRPIFGNVRYMNANGLRRKFDIEAYLKQVDALAR